MANGSGQKADHNVDREYGATDFVTGTVVKPTLCHHKHAGDAGTHNKSRNQPCPWMYDQYKAQSGCRGDCPEGSETSNVSNAIDQWAGAECTNAKANKVGGHGETDEFIGIALNLSA